MTMNAAAHSPEPNAPGLSTYEQIRAKNIERNNARLRALGLISKLEERLSNDLAWRRTAEARADVGDWQGRDGHSAYGHSTSLRLLGLGHEHRIARIAFLAR